MSLETLENLMKLTEKLSPQEKRQLANHLVQSADRNGENDHGLSASNEAKIRKSRDKWMRENREKYGGLYVALDGDKLIGTGKNYPEAMDKARKAGIEDAFVDFLPPVGYVGEIEGYIASE